MKLTALTAAIGLSLISATSVHAAKYRVVELPVSDIALNGFAVGISDSGKVLASASSVFNPEIDLSLLDLESEFFTENLDDIDAVRAGTPTTEDLNFLYNYLKANSSSQVVQPIADIRAYIVDESSIEPITGHNNTNDTSEFLTNSNTITVTTINAQNDVVGSSPAPHYKLPYQTEAGNDITYLVQDFARRGFVSYNGITVSLTPPDTTLGGYADAYSMNNQRQVVGYGSVDHLDALQTSIDNCNDDEARGDFPIETCFQTLKRSATIAAQFFRNGLIWQLNEAGDIESVKELGVLLTPEADDEARYSSRAVAINDNGIAVGESNDFFQDTTRVGNFAAIFDGDDVIGFTDHQEYTGSTATGINNNNLIIGHAVQLIAGVNRTKFFVHDYNTGETVFPNDFFNSSSSIARDINENNMVVGEGEVDTSSSNRRKAAFLYDFNNDTFEDINDLIACDSPYTIVQGNGINNDNEIAATATVYRDLRDIKGDPLTDDAGNAEQGGLTVAVKLVPIPGGQVEDCVASGDEQLFERSGASMGWLLMPLALLGIRRRKAVTARNVE